MTDAAFQPFERVALIGIGLIGSSLARAMRRGGLCREIVACARSDASRGRALDLGIADRAVADAADAVAGADLVVLCAPIGSYGALSAAIGPVLRPGAILTDVGSCKACVVRDVAPHVPDGVHFVPGHPVAGSEKSGPDAGYADLFRERWCILTPPAGTDAIAVERLAGLWRAVGSHVHLMAPDHHDKVLAITSHLPHLIAYSIVDTAANLETDTRSSVIRFSAGGFRDFTRIAGSDPVMWRDIFLNNKDAVLEMLGRFTEDLTALQRAIRRGDGELLQTTFTRTRSIRQQVVDARQAYDVPPLRPPYRSD